MRKCAVFLLAILILGLQTRAVDESFYLKERNIAQKLMPNTLQIRLCKGGRDEISVEAYPKKAKLGAIEWSISEGIAELIPNGERCVVIAHENGAATITARDENGATCEIVLKIEDDKSIVNLSASADTIKVGESAVIYARGAEAGEIKWTSEDTPCARISYGGRICRIDAVSGGEVKVYAAVEGSSSRTTKTIYIEPGNERRIDIDSIAKYLAVLAIALLAIIPVLRRMK